MKITTAISSEFPAAPAALRPMRLPESIMLFGVPAAAIALSLLALWPALAAAGMPKGEAYVVSLSLVNIGLLVAALAGYRLEGRPFTWEAFSTRMRLTRLSGRGWAWAVGGTIVFAAAGLLINSLAVWVFQVLNFSMPDHTAGPTPAGWMAVNLFFNIVGEELWWRGYILPRQELAHGKLTWLIHGTLWACFHMYKWFAVPFMLITCQIIPFVAQRTKSTWPGIINHLIINTASTIMAAL